MKTLHLDFFKPNSRGSHASGMVLLVTGMLAVIGIAKFHNETSMERHLLHSILDKQRNFKTQNSASGQLNDVAMDYQRAAAIIEQLSFPWEKLFQAIEKNTSDDIALLSIQPKMVARIITLDAESKSWDGMLNYIKSLEGDGFFSDVHLLSHQIQQSDPQRPVRFRLDCHWTASMIELVATPPANDFSPKDSP